MKSPFIQTAFSLAVLAASQFISLDLHAAESAELLELKQQIKEMREQYESRLKSLEGKLDQAQRNTSSNSASAASVTAQHAAVGKGNSFNPSVALILSGAYTNLRRDPETWEMTGFQTGDGEVGPGSKGFGLGESELTLSANIDPWWYGAMTIAFSPENEAGVEEAFVQTTALADGLKLKAGRFFSGVGYLNEQHAHSWDFVDAPLAYQAFFGGQSQQEGVQIKWLLPTDQFIELNGELGKGEGGRNGAGQSVVSAHIGGDVGVSNSWRLGASHVWSNTQSRSWVQDPDSPAEQTNTFNGKGKVAIIDGVWKWSPNGNASSTSLKLQGEYFRRQEQGTVDVNDSTPDLFKSDQSGWYLQAVYQFMPHWRLGLRQDQLDTGSVDYASNNATIARPEAKPKRSSLMLDWSPSEFSRWRLQVNNDQARQGIKDTQLYLQYQMSLGAHGAHGF
jgi:hypothetical protein